MRITKKNLQYILRNVPPPEVQISNGVRYLFCLPDDQIQFRVALHVFLPFIREKAEMVRVIMHQSLYPVIREIEPALIIPLIVTELDQQGIPTNQELLDLLQMELFVAADLNCEPQPATAYIVAKSRARMKIGFQSEHAEKLFNLVLNKSKDGLCEMAYRRILQLITISQPKFS